MSLFDSRQSHIAEGVIIGAITAVVGHFILRVLWALRIPIVLFCVGWMAQYYMSGDAKRDEIVAKNFDEKGAQVTSFAFSSERELPKLGHWRIKEAAPVITNNTPATLTKFTMRCTFFQRDDGQGYTAPNKKFVHFFYSKYPMAPLLSGETRKIAVDYDEATEADLQDADPSTIRCHLSTRTFDKREMVRAAMAKQ